MTEEPASAIRILKKHCDIAGYTYTGLDESDRILIVSDGKKNFLANPSWTYPLNSNSSSSLAKDKIWTNMFLRKNGFQTPIEDYFFTSSLNKNFKIKQKGVEEGLVYAESIGYPVFIKPNSGSCGIAAELDYSEADLRKHFDEIAKIDEVAVIQERIQQPEYRLFVLNGETQFAYSKSAAAIIGDGQSTIADLIAETNSLIKRAENYIETTCPFFGNQLNSNRLSLESILDKNEKLIVSPKGNLAAGSVISDYVEKIPKKTSAWAKQLVEKIGLNIAGIDIFVERSLDDPMGFKIIEVNGNPGLSGIYNFGKEEKAMEIWDKITKSYFKIKS